MFSDYSHSLTCTGTGCSSNREFAPCCWLCLYCSCGSIRISHSVAEGIDPPSTKRRSCDTSESLFAACWICNNAFVGTEEGCVLKLSDKATGQIQYNPARIHMHTHTRMLEYTHANGSVVARSIAKIHRNQIAYSHYFVFLICWLLWLNPPRCCSN